MSNISAIEVVVAGPQGRQGTAGTSTDSGGLTNQVLTKQSEGDYDTVWGSVDGDNVVLTSTSGIVSTNVTAAVDEVNTDLIAEGVRINTNITDIGIAQAQADLGVASAITAQATADVSTTNVGIAQTTADDAAAEAATNTISVAAAQLAADGAQVAADNAQATVDANAPFVYTFDHNSTSSFTVTGDVYEEVLRLTTVDRAAGTYKLDRAMLYSLNSTNTSAYFRISMDGGTLWTEIRNEPKDNTDLIPQSQCAIITHPGGIFDIIIQSRKENAADTLFITRMDAMLERKL